MTLIATIAATGQTVESFTTSPDLWARWRKLPMGTFVIGPLRTPAVLKRSKYGLQFFAAAPGTAGTTAPESIEHQVCKIKLVLGMRSAGYSADVERSGSSPTGEAWEADVLVQTARGPLAVEVQFSRQHWDEYRRRTARYLSSGVSVVWLVRDAHHGALANSKSLFFRSQGLSRHDARDRPLNDMPFLPLVKPESDEDTHRVIVYPDDNKKPYLRLSLEAFGAGIAAGALHISDHEYLDKSRSYRDWMWKTN